MSSTPTATGPGGSAPEEGGIMGFLKKNSGMLIGGLIGAVIMMMTGGGAMGMLFPIIGALLVGMLGDDKGMLSGIRESIMPSRTPAGSGPGASGPGVSAPAAGVSVAPTTPPLAIEANASLVVRNSTGVVSGVAVNGQPTFAPPTGSGPAASGPDIQIVENAPRASGATASTPAFRYTGQVKGNDFVITSVQAVIPGSNPPEFGLPSRPVPPVSLPIDATTGAVNFNQPAPTPPAPASGLAAAREQATSVAAANNNRKNFNLTELGDNKVSITLDPVVRDGASYQTTMIGSRAADGTVTFDRATMTETKGTPPVTSPVTNPSTGGTEFKVTGYIPPVRATAPVAPATTSTVAVTQGEAGNATEAVVDFTLSGRKKLEAAQTVARTARNTEIVGALNGAPNANQALNGLESTIARQYTNSGMNPFDANVAAQSVAGFYAESDNRGAVLNEAALRAQLEAAKRPAFAAGATGDRVFSDDQVNAIIAETKNHHTQIVAGLNGKPLQATPGASTPAPATAAGVDIARVAPPMAPPSASTPFNPGTAIPGAVPPSALNPSR
jgi:hypothetical protein